MNISKARGFTLVELMVTIAVLVILLSIAVPSFKNVLLNNRVTVTAHSLHSAVVFARSEAVKLRKAVTLCSAKADKSDCDSSADWTNGWLVKKDSEILKIWPSVQELNITGSKKLLRFHGDGTPDDVEELEVSAADCSNGVKHLIKINRIGQVRLERSSCEP